MTKWVDKVSRRGELTWAINFIAKTLRVHPPKQLSRIMIMHFRSFKHSNFQNFQRGLRSILHLCFPSTFVRGAARPFSFYSSFSKLIFIKCGSLAFDKVECKCKIIFFLSFQNDFKRKTWRFKIVFFVVSFHFYQNIAIFENVLDYVNLNLSHWYNKWFIIYQTLLNCNSCCLHKRSKNLDHNGNETKRHKKEERVR